MYCNRKEITLKDGRKAVLRSPAPSDAAGMNRFLSTCAAETDFILRYPEECVETEQEEARFLQALNDSPDGMMIVCTVDGEIAGNCQIAFNRRIKTRHRASVAIGLVRKYWGLGIGTAMFGELIAAAGERGVTRLELVYIEGNDRARSLYEKMGFVQTAEHPDAIRLRDGRYLKEYSMVRKL